LLEGNPLDFWNWVRTEMTVVAKFGVKVKAESRPDTTSTTCKENASVNEE